MKNIDKKEFGQRLRGIRKTLKLNQEVFAKKLGFSKTSISDYENGKKMTPVRLLYNLNDVFKINLNYFIQAEGEMFIDRDDMFLSGGGTVAPFGEFTTGIRKILETMKLSQFARAGIYTMAMEFLYKNSELVRRDIMESGAVTTNNEGANPIKIEGTAKS